MSNPTNLANNRAFYDGKYAAVSVDRLVAAMRDFPMPFIRARARGGSFAALYHDGLEERLAGLKVFEIGAGAGANAVFMAALGADVVTNDVSAESARLVAYLAERLDLPNLRPVVGELPELDLPRGHFDLVVGKGFLHHLTHEEERRYLACIAGLLAPGGEARFTDPARNAPLLSRLRLLLPRGGRPSALSRAAYGRWREEHRHPVRDNSSAHFRAAAEEWFGEVRVVPFGAEERLPRWARGTGRGGIVGRWIRDGRGPGASWLRHKLARRLLLVCRRPLHRRSGEDPR